MGVVLDASTFVGAAVRDDVTQYADGVMGYVRNHGAVVPIVFWFEVRNALRRREHEGTIEQHEVDAILTFLAVLDLTYDTTRSDDVLTLSRQHTIKIYDAAYLELAQRAELPMATLDKQLARAASDAGITLFTPTADAENDDA